MRRKSSSDFPYTKTVDTADFCRKKIHRVSKKFAGERSNKSVLNDSPNFLDWCARYASDAVLLQYTLDESFPSCVPRIDDLTSGSVLNRGKMAEETHDISA